MAENTQIHARKDMVYVFSTKKCSLVASFYLEQCVGNQRFAHSYRKKHINVHVLVTRFLFFPVVLFGRCFRVVLRALDPGERKFQFEKCNIANE